MEKVILRSYKGETIVKLVFTLGLCVAMMYWSMDSAMKLRISGAKLDHSTSVLLLRILAVVMVIAAVNELIKLFSIFKYGEFVLTMDNEKIIYPQSSSFKGFKPVSINKAQIHRVVLVDKGKNEFTIELVAGENQLLAEIPGGITSYKKMKPQELANKIHSWLHTN